MGPHMPRKQQRPEKGQRPQRGFFRVNASALCPHRLNSSQLTAGRRQLGQSCRRSGSADASRNLTCAAPLCHSRVTPQGSARPPVLLCRTKTQVHPKAPLGPPRLTTQNLPSVEGVPGPHQALKVQDPVPDHEELTVQKQTHTQGNQAPTGGRGHGDGAGRV